MMELENSIQIAKLMLKSYEERGGGYSQMQALQTLISLAQRYTEIEENGGWPAKATHTITPAWDGIIDAYNQSRQDMLLCLMKKLENMEKIIEIIENSSVGKSAIENWFPKGRSLQQFDEIAYNRFYRLAQAIKQHLLQDTPTSKSGDEK